MLAAVVAASVGLVGFVVTVSVLIVQMATGTFSARYMRIFYRDWAFKAVLAVLIGTFTFSYTLMRHVEEDDVPNLGVTLAGAFLGLGILLFVVFLDRAIHRLRPVAVAALVARAGRRALREVLAEAATPGRARGRAGAVQPAGRAGTRRAHGARRRDPGDRLPRAREVGSRERQPRRTAPSDRRLRLRRRGADRACTGVIPGRRRRSELRSLVALGVERTIEQDPAFAVRIMVDIAIRALSPAVNDPTTAVQVLDHLEDLLRLVGQTDLSDTGAPLEEMDSGLVDPGTAVAGLPHAERHRDPRVRARVDPGRPATPCDARGAVGGVLPERREAVLHELERLDDAVAARWGATVDVDLAGRSDRQGIGGPSATSASDGSTLLAAELTEEEAQSLVFVFLASTLGAVLSRWHLRLVLPTVVVEIVLGILIGPEVLGLAEVDPYIDFLSDFGLALLFFFAGLEVIEHHVPRDASPPRHDRLGHVARHRSGSRSRSSSSSASTPSGGCSASRSRRRRSARSSRSSRMRAASDRSSVAQCSAPESPASSGRSSSSPSSSRACTAR